MTTALFLLKNVNLTSELGVRVDRTGLAENLTTLDILTGNTTEQSADVVTSNCLVQGLSEHLKTGNNGGLGLVSQTSDLNGIVNLNNATLNSTSCNGTTASDGHCILNRHQERLVLITLRSRNVLVNSVHELLDASILGSVRIGGSAIQSNLSGTTDNGNFIAGEVILGQNVTDIHLYEVEQLGIVNVIALVDEYNDCRNAYLTSEKDVLLGLSHRAISTSNNEDSAVHLSSTGDHVLDIVSMAGAVNVSVVTLLGLVLNVSGVDCDTTLSLLRSLIDHVVSFELSLALKGKPLGDSSGGGGLTVVYVTDGTNVYVGLGGIIMFLCHGYVLLNR